VAGQHDPDGGDVVTRVIDVVLSIIIGINLLAWAGYAPDESLSLADILVRVFMYWGIMLTIEKTREIVSEIQRRKEARHVSQS
jgi:hypothetical protein